MQEGINLNARHESGEHNDDGTGCESHAERIALGVLDDAWYEIRRRIDDGRLDPDDEDRIKAKFVQVLELDLNDVLQSGAQYEIECYGLDETDAPAVIDEARTLARAEAAERLAMHLEMRRDQERRIAEREAFSKSIRTMSVEEMETHLSNEMVAALREAAESLTQQYLNSEYYRTQYASFARYLTSEMSKGLPRGLRDDQRKIARRLVRAYAKELHARATDSAELIAYCERLV